MRTVHDMMELVESINIDEEIEHSLIDSQEPYTDLQKAQLLEGKRSDGKNIFRISTGSDEYSDSYAKKKGKKKPIDLHDKGDFSFEIFMDVRDKELFIDSADPKSGMLQEDYGDEIFGLADKRGSEFAEHSGGVLTERVTEKLK